MGTLTNLTAIELAVVAYLALINAIAFISYGYDKINARSGAWRVSEKRLWLLALFGGSIGTLLGMKLFRHKTKKASFLIVMAAILLFQLALVTWYFTYKTNAINTQFIFP